MKTRFDPTQLFVPEDQRTTFVTYVNDTPHYGPFLTQISESVRLFNNPAIWFKDNELHTSLKDLNEFWAFHKERLAS